MLLKQHLDMIGRNEPIQRKAKFWQSYVRALKDDPSYMELDPEEAHLQRMDAISDLLPMKYRYPHFYHPHRSSSVPPRASSVPPSSYRDLSRARSITPAPPHIRDIVEDRPTYRKPIYTYTGTNAPRFTSALTSYTGNVLSSHLANYTVYKHLHYYTLPRSVLHHMSHEFENSIAYRR